MSQISVSESCLGAGLTAPRQAADRVDAAGGVRDAQAKRAAVQLAQPHGFRIRHEYDKRVRHFDENSANPLVAALSSATQNDNLQPPPQ